MSSPNNEIYVNESGVSSKCLNWHLLEDVAKLRKDVEALKPYGEWLKQQNEAFSARIERYIERRKQRRNIKD